MQTTDQADVGVLDRFQTDLVDAWGRLPNKGFFLSLLLAWIALFSFVGNSTFGYIDTSSLFLWMYNAYKSTGPTADDGHGLFIPFVVLGLFWWRRHELLALRIRIWWPALFLIAFALVLHVLGYVVQQARLSVVGLFVGIYGLMGLAWGREWLRTSFFPFFLFGFCVPLGSLTEVVTFPLRILVCRLVEWISHFILAIDVIRQGTALSDPTGKYQYEVAVACSGMRSLISTIAMGCVFAFVFNMGKWWKRIVLIAAAFPLAVLGNLIRMLLIVVVSDFWGQEAGNWVHDGGQFGEFSLLPYVPGFLGLLYLADWFEKSEKKEAKTKAGSTGATPVGASERISERKATV